jgi:hypothetical protein
MAYGKEYRGEWMLTDDTTPVRFSIYDTTLFVADPNDAIIVPMQMGPDPLIVEVIDNSKDKFKPGIKPKQAQIQVYTENGIDISTFTAGADLRWYVEAKQGTDYIFRGFLMLPEISQPFLPDAVLLNLTASDMLASLKDLPLTDFSSTNPTGPMTLINYFAWALSKTGLVRNIYAAMNIRHGSGVLTNQALFSVAGQYFVTSGLKTDFFYEGQEIIVTNSVSNNGTYRVLSVDNSGVVTQVTIDATITTGESTLGVIFTDTSTASHLYETVYEDAKTFEDSIGKSKNCYDVLEKLIGEDCILTQYAGDWWIFRIDEYDDNLIMVRQWDDLGVFVADLTPATYLKTIGTAETLRYAGALQILQRDRPLNKLIERFNYDTWQEIVCNIDFSRGDFIADVSTEEKKYDLDCWTLREGTPGNYGTVDGTTATIHRKFNGVNYEKERYAVLTPRTTHEGSSITDVTYIESSALPVIEKDKVSVSVNWRLNLGIATGGNGSAILMRLVLNGDDGSWWILGEATTGDGFPKWFNTSGWTVNSAKGVVSIDFDTINEEEWQTQSWEAPPAPVSGNMYIWLNQFNQLSSSDDNKEVWYNNLSVDYNALINGSYQKYSGQHHQVTRPDSGYFAKREEEVFISDSPRKIFKGSMLLLVNGAYVLTSRFYAYNVFNSGNYPGDGYTHPFGEIQAFSVWNQYRNANWIIEGTLHQIGAAWPDLIHKYAISDSHVATNNRYFICTGFTQNWKTGTMKLTLIECYDRILGKIYSDTHEFKYLTNG